MASGERITDLPSGDQLGPAGFFNWYENRQGLMLGTYFWPVEKPRAVVLLLHGHGAHLTFAYLKPTAPGEKPVYSGSWAEALNQNGYSVCGIDNQSCGRSEGVDGHRCYFHAFSDIVHDTHSFAMSVKGMEDVRYGNLPMFVLGGSAGGCAAVHLVHRHPGVVDGVILLAPMLSLEKVTSRGINRIIKPLAGFLSWLLPLAPFAATGKNEMFPDVQEYHDQDPACWHTPTRLRIAHEFLKATEWVVREMGNMDFPFLCIHSKDDTMCDLEGSKQLFDRSKAKDKKLEVVKDMWHILVHEPGWERILGLVISWLNDRAPGK